MALHSYINNLNAGELSPLLQSRTDSDKYRSGCLKLENMIPLVQGGVRRRPGLEARGIIKDAAKLLGFNFSTTTSFVIEFTPRVARFWSNGSLVPNPLTSEPLQITTPFDAGNLSRLQSCQLNDVIYLCDGAQMPRVLERRADDNWKMRELHEPRNGFADISGNWTAGSTNTGVIKTWVTPDKSVGTVQQAVNYMTANAPTSTSAAGQPAPIGTGNTYVASIQRLQGFFTAPSSGTFEIRARDIDDFCRVRFCATAGVSNANAVDAILLQDTAAGTLSGTSQAFTIVSGSDYWIEFILGDWTKPSGGVFEYRINGGSWTSFSAFKDAAAPASPTENELIEGWPAMLDVNADDITITPSGTTGQITLAASAAIFQSGHVGAYWQIAHYRDTARTVLGPGSAGTANSTGIRVVGPWDIFTYGRWTGTLLLQRKGLNSTTWETIRSWEASNNERNVAASGVELEECELRLRGVSLADNSSSSGSAFWVLEAADTRITGLVKITAVTDGKNASAYVVRSLGATTATKAWAEGAWSAVRGYPNAVAFYEQRLLFGGTTSNPQRIHGSTIGDFEHFLRGSNDDSALDFTLAAADGNPIQWMASQQGLIIGTTGDEWLIDSGSSEKPITPTNVRIKRQSRYGSAAGLPALIVGEVALFIQRGGRKVREFVYAFERDGWVAPDLSLLAEHITASGIKSVCYQGIPESRLWCVLTDGTLVGMVYERDQKVIAWHRHKAQLAEIEDTAYYGEFVSCTSIYGTSVDEVWFCIKDTRPDEGGKHYICRFHPGTASGAGPFRYNDFFHTSELSFTDYAGNLITAPTSAGFASTWTLQPMPLAMDMQDGTSRGRTARVPRMVVEVIRTSGVKFTDNPDDATTTVDNAVAIGDDGSEVTGNFTGDLDLNIDARHRRRTAFALLGNGSGEVNITGIVPKWEVYGD